MRFSKRLATIRRGASTTALGTALLGTTLLGVGMARAADTAPAAIKIGTLYAGSGPYSSISMPVYDGLRLWVHEVNAQGGVYVKPYGKNIPVKLIAYNDQSSTSTATSLYNQLITQDKVTILVADSGSVLTSVAVPLAQEHKMLLFNQTGTGTNFFSSDDKYNVLLDDPVSSLWPHRLAGFISKTASHHGVHKVAILYSTNDFTEAQATALKGDLQQAKDGVKIVYYKGVPTSTTNYDVLLHTIRAHHPDALVELGYPNNDIAFLKALDSSGFNFRMVFAIYPGLATQLLEKNVGGKAMLHDFTYVPATGLNYTASFGMNMSAFTKAYRKQYGHDKGVGFNAVAGYNTGLIIQKTLANTTSLNQLALRKAVFGLSGSLTTLDGRFKLTPDGAQVGEVMPVGQIQKKDGAINLIPVYPAGVARAKPVWSKQP